VRRLLLAVALVAIYSSQALPAEPRFPKRQPIDMGDGGTWVATIRVDMSGVILDAGPHVQMLCTSAMGKSGVPQNVTAGGGSSVMMALTPEEAREMADALTAWADNPTDSVIFTRSR
jgi:hypothetical protein